MEKRKYSQEYVENFGLYCLEQSKKDPKWETLFRSSPQNRNSIMSEWEKKNDLDIKWMGKSLIRGYDFDVVDGEVKFLKPLDL